jgi:tRNA A-37 threonylcarbamoyl transferase component Bud32
VSEERITRASTIECLPSQPADETVLVVASQSQAPALPVECTEDVSTDLTMAAAVTSTHKPESGAGERCQWRLPNIYLRMVHQTQEYYRLVHALRKLDHAQDVVFAMMSTFIVAIMCLQIVQHCAEATQAHAMADFVRSMYNVPGMSDADALSDLRGLLFLLYSIVFIVPMTWMITVNSVSGNAGSFCKNTHLCISDAGVSTLRMAMFSFKHPARPWNTLRCIKHVKPSNKRSPSLIRLEFSRGLPIDINLHKFTSDRETQVLLCAVKAYRPDLCEQVAELEKALLPESGKTYTELWSKSLLHDTERLRLSALPPDTSLQNGRFRIVDQLGSGGQGTAYLTEDLVESKLIVLKEYILPDSRNVHDCRRAITRLEDEAHLLSRLQHEQIVKALDIFLEDHRAYLMLEHIDGPPIKSLVAERGAMTEMEVIDLASQMCNVLEYLHEQSPPMVHQDFTPDNLLLTESHVLKLVDFNVAKEKQNSKTSLVVGKHAYMPPEQFRGKACPQSDIYAMGATLYLMLTGVEPEPLTCCHPIERQPVSVEMDRIVARATALELTDRYQNVREISEDLRALREQEAKV